MVDEGAGGGLGRRGRGRGRDAPPGGAGGRAEGRGVGFGVGGGWAGLASAQLMVALPLLVAAAPLAAVLLLRWRGLALLLAWYLQRVLRPEAYARGGDGALSRMILQGWGRVVGLGALRYFPAALVEEARLKPRPQGMLLGLHPHGFICSPVWLHLLPSGAFAARHGLELRFATINVNFWCPVWTDVLVLFGFISAGRKSLEAHLRAGRAVGLVVGGAEEAAATATDRFDLVLRKRKGFVKCALRTGAALVPVVSLGENRIIRQAALPKGHWLQNVSRPLFRLCQRHLGFVPMLPYGRPLFGGLLPVSITPFQSQLVTVVGKPLAVPEIADPTSEQVEYHHARYLAEVARIYDTYKDQYGLVNSPPLRFIA